MKTKLKIVKLNHQGENFGEVVFVKTKMAPVVDRLRSGLQQDVVVAGHMQVRAGGPGEAVRPFYGHVAQPDSWAKFLLHKSYF